MIGQTIFMKKKIILLALLSGLLCPCSLVAETSDFRKALELYNAGMFGSARTLFEKQTGELAQGYAVICALKLDWGGAAGSAAHYVKTYPKSPLSSQIRFLTASDSFYGGKYADALAEYQLISEKHLPKEMKDEYLFNKSFCLLEAGNAAAAGAGFSELEKRSGSQYRMPSRYYLGYIAYTTNNVADAQAWFEQSEKDPRFALMSRYYLVECHFLRKDYDYVITNGPAILNDAPEGTGAQLSRMISEAYLVKGNPQKAKEYFDKEIVEGREMSRSDYFHAGSVLFGVNDFRGAIENFSKMSDRTDSLGQIANSRLGYSFIKTGDKVSALAAFNEAAKCSYNPDLQEDACFNYAKLAFDINHDAGGFEAYLSKYQDSRRGELVYDYMALAELFNKNYDSAIEYYSQIEKLNEKQLANFAKANFLRGQQLVGVGSTKDAVPYFKATSLCFPKNDPFSQLARYQLAEAAYTSGNYELAAQTFTELYNTSALHGKQEGKLLPYNVAYSFLKQENYSASSRWFDIYLSEGDPFARADALCRRADCDFYSKNYKSALGLYQKAAEECDEIYPLYSKALCAGLLGDKSGKLETLKLAVSKDKSMAYWPEAVYELGRSYVDVGKEEEAIAAFDELKSQVDDKILVAKANIGKGMAYGNSSKYDEALACYKTVVSEMKDNEYGQDALLAIESIYQSMRRPELYLEYVESIKADLGKTPAEREKMYFNTAEQIYLAGNYEQAERSLNKYLDEYPNGNFKGEALFYLADSQKQLGNKETAVESFALAAAALPSGSFREQAKVNVAALSYSLERFSEAYAAYSELYESAAIEQNKTLAAEGKLRSAYKSKQYEDAVKASEFVQGDESRYIKAQSLLAVSRREEAMAIFEELSKSPSTPFGAEATYLIIQDTYNRGAFADVPEKVFDFSKKAGSQNYWLAKAYVVLGDSYAERGNFAQAKATFESIKKGYTEKDDVYDGVVMRLNKLNEMGK